MTDSGQKSILEDGTNLRKFQFILRGLNSYDKSTFCFDFEYITKLCLVEIGDFNFIDNEDAYRLDYLRRKWPVAPNILQIMTEGHTEDFFGAWDSNEESPHPDAFDTGAPVDWQTIFDIP